MQITTPASTHGWIKICIDVDPNHVDPWSEHFLAEGALCVDVGNAQEGTPEENPIFGEPGEEHQRFWHTNRVSALFEPRANFNWPEWLNTQAQAISLTFPHFTVSIVDDQDWVTLTQTQFQPIQISPRFWILSSWHQKPVQPDTIHIVVDPGMAFGTGTHPTTRLCLRWMEKHLSAGQTVLDYGCGSGILAIAAAKLSASHVTGVDIDPVALEVTQNNAEANHVHVHTHLPHQLNATIHFNYVIANILANPLRALAPILCQHTANDGTLILSGLWREQAHEITEHYRKLDYVLHLEDSEEGWALLVGHRIKHQHITN